MTKPSTAQAKFMNAILKHGGDQVPGSRVFGKREYPIVHRMPTIQSCKDRGWVRRDERDGDRMALWTVTTDGRTAMGL